MGVGKTTVCQLLKKKLPKSVFLDGDWCWDADPFQVTEETKKMVLENIAYLLNNFIRCTAYDHVIFCWVMHEQAIVDELTARLHLHGCRLHVISLVCSPEALKNRLLPDVQAGMRQPDILERSPARLPLYEKLHTVKIDVSALSPEETAEKVLSTAIAEGYKEKTDEEKRCMV